MSYTFEDAWSAAQHADGLQPVEYQHALPPEDFDVKCTTEDDRTSHGKSPSPKWLPEQLDLDNFREWAERPIDWVIVDLLPTRSAAVLTGLGASGKSTLLKQLAVSIATGIPTCGFIPACKGDVVLLLAEDTADDTYRSLNAILKQINLDDESIKVALDRLHLFSSAGRDNEMLTCSTQDKQPGEPNLRLEEFIQFCKTLHEVRLVGLDPAIALSKSRELDEIGQREVASAVERIAVETGAAVVLVTHASKSLQFVDDLHSHASRGSGALTDAFRLEMTMRSMTAKEQRQFVLNDEHSDSFVQFKVTKCNRLGPDAKLPRWLRREEGGVLALAHLDAKEKSSLADQRAASALKLFFRTDDQTGELREINLSMNDFKRDADASGLLTGENPAAISMSAKRLIDMLKAKNWVAVDENKNLVLTPTGRELCGPEV